ncbi:MAG: PaaI family thioesterase [Rhodobacteraceae bacterium]|nr:PaaI family thioesterase [Paracoccaceae bacterium]
MTSTLSPAIAAKLRASFADQAMMATLGAELVGIGPGTCEIAAPILPGATQQHGYGHAGLMFSIADSAMGVAALSLMPEDAEVLSIEVKINLLSPARAGRLIARGRVVRPGRRVMVVQGEVAELTDGTEKLIAILQGTMIPA